MPDKNLFFIRILHPFLEQIILKSSLILLIRTVTGKYNVRRLFIKLRLIPQLYLGFVRKGGNTLLKFDC